MKKLILWMTALALLAGNALYAQNISGTWQGELNPPGSPKPLRLVFKIALEDDKLKATAYSIDQGGQPIPVSAVTRDGSTVKMTIAAINGSYEGKLSADANLITGTFTQGSPLPLNLARATPATEWSIPEPLPPPTIMAADARPEFEVATIKPSQNPEGFAFLVNRSGMLNTHNTSLKDLIKISYGVHPKQITGGPSWFENDKYDVTGKPNVGGMPSVNQLMGMVQKMLAERFKLEFHREKKELSAYTLTLGKTGLKITENTSNPTGLPGFGGGGPRGLNVRNATMKEFADFLQANVLDQPVVDQTGLGSKRYDFILKWTPDGPQAAAAAGNVDAPPDIYAAMQQQLGLKLESAKAPVDVIVIDHVEKPSEN
jgi:uncharacterized protein (TIGR03435 family)